MRPIQETGRAERNIPDLAKTFNLADYTAIIQLTTILLSKMVVSSFLR